jgi:hypothetical protein
MFLKRRLSAANATGFWHQTEWTIHILRRLVSAKRYVCFPEFLAIKLRDCFVLKHFRFEIPSLRQSDSIRHDFNFKEYYGKSSEQCTGTMFFCVWQKDYESRDFAIFVMWQLTINIVVVPNSNSRSCSNSSLLECPPAVQEVCGLKFKSRPGLTLSCLSKVCNELYIVLQSTVSS